MQQGDLARDDIVEVMMQITPVVSDLHLESQMSKGQAAVETLFFTYTDLATDILLIVEYYAKGRSGTATLMLAVLVFSLVVQALFGHISGQGEGVRGGGGARVTD